MDERLENTDRIGESFTRRIKRLIIGIESVKIKNFIIEPEQQQGKPSVFKLALLP